MNRREFLKTSALTAVAVAAMSKLPGAALSAAEAPAAGPLPDLVAVRNGTPAEMFRKGIEALGGMKAFVKPGQKVVVKPNIGWDKKPEEAANTNPELVAEIVRQALAAGASEVTVFDHTCNEWQSCYKNSGIAAAVTEAGGKVLPANLKEHYSRVERPEAGENEERPDPQRDPRSGCVHQRAGAQTPRRSQNVLRDEEFHGAGRRPRLHAPERSAAVHRRRGALPQAGPQRGGRLPHRDLQRAARRDAGGCENSEIPAAFPRHRRRSIRWRRGSSVSRWSRFRT